jgi:uncharacterized repeat protein (TIGR01451 family)
MLNLRGRAALASVAVLLLFVGMAAMRSGGGGPEVSTANDGRGEPAEVEVLAGGEAAEDIGRDDVPVAVARVDQDGFSGVAETDLPAADPNVVIVMDSAGAQDGAIPPQAPLNPDGSTPITGWDIEDVRFRYDPTADALVVAINSYGVVGDPEGNGDPAQFSEAWGDANVGGVDSPDLGAEESVALMLDLDQDGSADVLVGVHTNIDLGDIQVAALSPFGAQIPTNATLAAQAFLWGETIQSIDDATTPSETAPDLVFTIQGFSNLPGADDDADFGVNLVMGSGLDGNIGEDTLAAAASLVPVNISAELGDRVFQDTNRNGIQDDEEAGAAGVTVNLFDAAGDVIDSSETDATGSYLFTVNPGDYSVEFVPGNGQSLTVQNAGASPELDSDAAPATGRTATVTLTAGQSDLTIDAGVVAFQARPGIDLEKATNGLDSDTGPGEDLLVGDDVTFTYVVRNTGNVDLVGVSVSDNIIGSIACPQNTLDVNESMTCEVSTTVLEGNYVNTGTASGTPVDADGQVLGAPVTDSDPSHHRGVLPLEAGINLEKDTNGEDADEPTGPRLVVGELATFTYVVTNTGNIELTDVIVTDDDADVIGQAPGFVCRIDLIGVGEAESCTATRVVTEGQYVNIGSVSAQPVDPQGENVGGRITDEDPSHHVGEVQGPACTTSIRGIRMWAGGATVDDTGWNAAAGSTIRIVTDEPGGSPEQPNEQVYVLVDDVLYGPTPAGLGEAEFRVNNSGPVVIVHWSEVSGDTSLPNSVEYEWCGTGLSKPTIHTCPNAVTGPRMFKGDTVYWDTGLVAAAGSTIELTTSEPGGSPGQPHEQVYVTVGEEVFGPTLNEHGTNVFTVGAGGPIVVQHYSEFHQTENPNSVEMTLCGSDLYEG